jgi:hypothetical protein
MPSSGLVLTSAASISGVALQSFVTRHQLELKDVTVVTCSGTLQKDHLERSSFDAALSLSDVPQHHTPAFLGLLGAALRPGATLVVQEPVRGGEVSGAADVITSSGPLPVHSFPCQLSSVSFSRCLAPFRKHPGAKAI